MFSAVVLFNIANCAIAILPLHNIALSGTIYKIIVLIVFNDIKVLIACQWRDL
jgi:hypothetical protein